MDHFVPWARYPDNGIRNFVVADPRCNGNKREACRSLDISYHTLQSYLRFPVNDPADSAENSAGEVPPDWGTGEEEGTGLEAETM